MIRVPGVIGTRKSFHSLNVQAYMWDDCYFLWD